METDKRITLKVQEMTQHPVKSYIKKADFDMESRISEGAVICSGRVEIPVDSETTAVLSARLEEIAENIRSLGGIPGHLKASLSEKNTTLISVTGRKADIRSALPEKAELRCTLIAFKVSQPQMEEMLESVFELFAQKWENI